VSKAIAFIDGTPVLLLVAENGKWRWYCQACGASSKTAMYPKPVYEGGPSEEKRQADLIREVTKLARQHVKQERCG
jgi:hypothetical protein